LLIEYTLVLLKLRALQSLLQTSRGKSYSSMLCRYQKSGWFLSLCDHCLWSTDVQATSSQYSPKAQRASFGGISSWT